MRKLFILLLFVSLNMSAQDVIVKKDGSTILSKVLEVNPNDVKYKKFSNQNGPTYTINKLEILSINYENGDKDMFDDNNSEKTQTTQASSDSSSPRLIQKKAAENNVQLIESYKTEISQINKEDKKNAAACNIYFEVTQNSILANEDLEISFLGNGDYAFDIVIENKSNRMIYIDKGNCFRVINGNNPYCYYNATEQITVGRNSGGGVSLGIGSVAGVMGVGGKIGQLANGVSVNGGTSNSSSTTYVSQRVIAIPPYSKKNLCENKEIEVSRNWFKTIDPNEDFASYDKWGIRPDGSHHRYGYDGVYSAQFGMHKGYIKVGQVLSYNENDTPYRRVYTITYSHEESFSTYTTINFTLYIRHALGRKVWTDKGMDNIVIRHNSDHPLYLQYVELK